MKTFLMPADLLLPGLPPAAYMENPQDLPLVSVITVNYNQHAVTEDLLQSIFSENTYPHLEVIVVDNGSKTDPVPLWRQKYPSVIFLRSAVNLGFAGGNNLGIEAAEGDFLFLVNNDTEFTPSLVMNMAIYMLQDDKIGIASPKIMYYDKPDMIQYAGFTPINYYTCRNACIGQYEQDNGQYDQRSGQTGYAHGAAMMIRRQALNDAGMMPEGYFLYYEELDWCEAIRRAGYHIHVNTGATIYHKESVSVGKLTAVKEYFMNRNRILFIRRNASWTTTLVFYCYFLGVVAPRNIFRYLRSNEPGFMGAFIRALLWHLKHSANSRNIDYIVP